MESPCDETERSGDRVSLEAHLKDLRIDGLAESIITELQSHLRDLSLNSESETWVADILREKIADAYDSRQSSNGS
jgi:hypothetical protein